MIRFLPIAGFGLLLDQLTKDAAVCLGTALLIDKVLWLALLVGIVLVGLTIAFRHRCGWTPLIFVATGVFGAVLDLALHHALVIPWHFASVGVSVGLVLLLIGLTMLGRSLFIAHNGGKQMKARIETVRPFENAPRGMTLIEILVVITIIGIVITVVAVGVVGWLSDAKVETSRTQVDKIASAVMQYTNMKNELPSDLKVLVERKYISNKQTKDPWRNDLNYQPGSSNDLDDFILCSNGLDESEGTEDDICWGDDDE